MAKRNKTAKEVLERSHTEKTLAIAEMFQRDLEEDPMRGTGRTTAQVLMTIAQALMMPGQNVAIVDHEGWNRWPAEKMQACVEMYCGMLNLKHIEITAIKRRGIVLVKSTRFCAIREHKINYLKDRVEQNQEA